MSKLLVDISGEYAPCGPSVRYEPIYDEIQEMFREDDALPQGVWERDTKVADWKGVEALCLRVLTEQSKDLQVMGWLAESWLVQDDLAGLIRGLEGFLGLTETYWEFIHPLPENGDFEFRFSPYIWANNKLSQRLHMVRIASKDSGFPSRFAQYLQWKHSQEHNLSTKEAQFEDIRRAIKATDYSFYVQLRQQAETCIDLSRRIENYIDGHSIPDSPSFYKLREALDEMIRFCDQALHETKDMRNTAEVNQDANITAVAGEESTSDASMVTTISTREEAYSQAERIATYLQKVEPHSPAPYLIRKAIVWGRMSFEDMLREFAQDPNMMQNISRFLDMEEPNRSGPPTHTSSPVEGQSSQSTRSVVTQERKPTKPLWTIED